MDRACLCGCVTPSKGSLEEESELLNVHINNGFDPNGHNLKKKSSYGFNKLASLR